MRYVRRLTAILAIAAVTGLPAIAAPERLSIDVHDAQLSDVLTLLGSEAHVNIVTDASVRPEKVTLHLKDVTFDQALNAIVSSNGLLVHRDGPVLIVGAAESMNRRYDAENHQRGAATVVLSLRYAHPDEVAKEIGDALPPGTVIVADKRTSAVVITADDDTIARTRRLVAALDAAPAVDGPSASTKRYALQYLKVDDIIKALKSVAPDGIYLPAYEQNAVLVSGSAELQDSVQSVIAGLDVPSPQVLFEVRVADVTPQNDQYNVGLEFGGIDFNGQPVNGSTTYLFTHGSIPVTARLNAMISEGRAQILATPKLVTINNKEADLLIGQTYPVVFTTSVLGGQNVQFVDVGVKLRLTPTIGTDGMVTAELHPEYSEILGFNASGFPIIANRKIDSTLRVANDETIVLGGLMRDVSSETISRIPGLSNIPVLGHFFRNKGKNHERDEIVFLITPHVIRPGEHPVH